MTIDLDRTATSFSRSPRSRLAVVLATLLITAMFVPVKGTTITVDRHPDQGGWSCTIMKDGDTLLSGYYDKYPDDCTWPLKS